MATKRFENKDFCFRVNRSDLNISKSLDSRSANFVDSQVWELPEAEGFAKPVPASAYWITAVFRAVTSANNRNYRKFDKADFRLCLAVLTLRAKALKSKLSGSTKV